MPGSPLSAPREMRARWYLQVDKYGKSIKEVCGIFGVSKKTYHKWYNKDHGYGSRKYESRKDHPDLKLTPRIKLAIYEAKIKYRYGPLKMKWYLKDKFKVDVSTTIIYRYYKRRRLIMKPQRNQPWYAPMKERFVSTKPGENVQLDVKYVPAINGTWNYQFRFTDTYTNMQYAIDSLVKSSTATIHAFAQAKRYFPFPIIGIQTDNGSEFRGLFAGYLNLRGVIHRFIPKRSAPWNGKVERANRSIDDEYYLNSDKPWNNLSQYVHWYNYDRYHGGKNMDGLKPIQKYQQYLASLDKERVTLEC
jgi:transposase